MMSKKIPLTQKKLFLLDMDGTLYLGDRLFRGTLPFLKKVKEYGKRYSFMTNNSSKSHSAYIEKLARLGIEATEDDFVTSADVTIEYLTQNFRNTLIYVSGTASFMGELERAGLRTTTEYSENIGALVIGYDTELTYKKLTDSCHLLDRGVPFIATNPDWVCPTVDGYLPDCGSICEMLTKATGKKPLFMGKPESNMPLYALRKYKCKKEDAVIVGDRLYTDIKCAVNSGIDGIFVLSGEGKLSDINEMNITPTYILNSVGDIFPDSFESGVTSKTDAG